MKSDAPSLLQAGIHNVTSHKLKEIAVDAFPSDRRRAELFGKFLAWRDALRSCGVSGRLWLDGSFLTSKIGPGDIDLVLWCPTFSGNLTVEQKSRISSLLDKATCRSTYELDLYFEQPEAEKLLHRQAYWKGWLGYCHDGVTAKGIAEVAL